LRVTAAQLKTEAATLAGYGWPIPGPGEIVLVALNGDRVTIAARHIAADMLDDAVGVGMAFLKQNMPPARDARALLTAASEEAQKSGRRVWIVVAGPRCGPCFLLARWMDEHHTVLEKDYVIVKVMDGVDEHVAGVIEKLPPHERSIPWHVIAEPDGTVLATSEGPLGNIGFPGSVEGIRHFRRMLDLTVRRLKSDEVDGLVRSFSP
jgi:hypothetical protein